MLLPSTLTSSRLLCDDGHTTSCPTGVRQTQGVRRVGSCAAAGACAVSPMRQESRGPSEPRPHPHSRSSSNRRIDPRGLSRPEVHGEYTLKLPPGRTKTRGHLRTCCRFRTKTHLMPFETLFGLQQREERLCWWVRALAEMPTRPDQTQLKCQHGLIWRLLCTRRSILLKMLIDGIL